MKKLINLRNSLITLFSVLLVAVVVSLPTNKASAHISPQYNYNVDTDQGFVQGVLSHGVRESLSSNGLYSVTFRVATGAGRDISFPYRVELHKCKEGNGNIQPQGYCGEAGVEVRTGTISLNSSNNYAQEFTFETQQNPAQACGSFQTDFSTPRRHAPEDAIGSSIYRTGVNCVTVQPSPSPSPSVKPSPSPSPSVVPSPSPSVKPSQTPQGCPVGQVVTIKDSQITCVNVEQTQNNNQNQNNNQTQNNNNNQNTNVTANGGNSSSTSSSNVSVNVTQPSQPQVVTKTETVVKELPKTGLPLAGLALASLLPVGLRFRKVNKSEQVEESANSVWTERQLKS